MINIHGIDKATLLQALYDRAGVQGLGILHYVPGPLPRDEAESLTSDKHRQECGGMLYFDYLKGRVLKVEISTDEIDPRFYDRDNGFGACQLAVNAAVNAQNRRTEGLIADDSVR